MFDALLVYMSRDMPGVLRGVLDESQKGKGEGEGEEKPATAVR